MHKILKLKTQRESKPRFSNSEAVAMTITPRTQGETFLICTEMKIGILLHELTKSYGQGDRMSLI
jgi:hypothetical protein